MQGKTVVITGATSGIGEVAAIRLAELGARIIHIARDEKRAAATQAALKKANPAANPVLHLADLSLLSEMRRVARAIAAAEPKIDVLINNAGAMVNKRQVTADGLEKTFALNHMAYFVITNMLLPNIVDHGRIVVTASNAHRGASLDFDDLQSERGYRGFGVYSETKLMNILFTRALARRLESGSGARGITANALHPGFVATRFGDQSGGVLGGVIKLIKPLGAISPEAGAKTIIYLASSPDVAGVSGQYFFECNPTTPTHEALNDDDGERLWKISEGIAELPADDSPWLV
ncbi:MAG: SDR family oxidoreductase [Alphaproteobacteria bacterium]|nr:SDR family oxidoreductase [Alphaproteobacteria bacterium]